MPIHELLSLIEPPRPPSDVPVERDWDSVELELGVKLPRDYRDFIDIYGSGLLANFIRVFNPFASSEYVALIPCVHRISQIRRSLKQSEGEKEVPYAVFPESPGILPWGNDENGNTLYWFTCGHPDEWPTVVGEGRGRRWKEYGLSMTGFLSQVLRGEIRCDIWPDDFPNGPEDFTFSPY